MSNVDQHDGQMSPYHIPALSRAVAVLERLAISGAPMRLADLSRELSIPRSSLFSILATLVEEELVEREGTAYRTGHRLARLALASGDGRTLSRAARPVLAHLVGELSESAQVAVLDGGQARYVEVAEGTQALRVATWVGKRNPLDKTAIGMALLLETSEGKIRDLVPGLGDEDLARLRAELTEARSRGYTVDEGAGESGVYCVGAPIRDAGGAIVAALSVSVPKARLSVRRLPHVAELVIQASLGVSENLGWSPR